MKIMNLSQALTHTILNNETTITDERFVILANRTPVQRSTDFFFNTMIVQMQGSMGQELDYMRTIQTYQRFYFRKGDRIEALIDGKIEMLTFHHFYCAFNDCPRYIALRENGDEIHRAASTLLTER